MAIDKGEIVGYGSIKLDKRELVTLYIRKEFINLGHGTKLLKYIEKYAKKEGINNLETYTTFTAFDFYIKNGYEKVRKVIPNKNNNFAIACILMKKKLWN